MTYIDFSGVTIDFPIYDADRSMRRMLGTAAVGGKIVATPNRLTVTALRDINFALVEGDRVGLIGHNGAGKSTLLRVIAGVYPPVRGTITVRGKVVPLLALGIGLDEEDTGWENIYTGCLFFGMTPAEIKRQREEIAAFSELGDYMNMPLRTYSGGMRVRLSFAIATAQHPDILLLDEVIGAGDAAFAIKARQRIETMMARASILMLASHSDDLIRQFCNKALYLKNGEIAFFGEVEEALAAYAATR